MLQQIAVVHRAQPEVLELAIAFDVDGVVQLARIARHELGEAIVHEPEAMRGADGLRERVDFLVRALPCR